MLVARATWRALLRAGTTVMVVALVPATARAQVLGTWATAIPYAGDEMVAGGFFLVGEPIGIVGQFRTGIADKMDVGVQLGVPNFDLANDTVIGLAGDTKYLILPEKGNFPLDLAVDGAFGYQHADKLTLVDFDFGAVASKKFVTSGGRTLVPYGSLMFAVGHASVDRPKNLPENVKFERSNTDLDVNVRVGLDWPFRPGYEAMSEVNLSSRDETLAISFGLMTRL